MFAWSQLKPPHFPLLESTEGILATRRHREDEHAFWMLDTFSSAVSNTIDCQHPSRYSTIAKHAAIIAIDYDQYTRHQSRPPRMPCYKPDEVLTKYTRLAVLHDLLSIPDPGSPSLLTSPALVDEAHRLSLLAFACLVLVPAPEKVNNIAPTLATRLVDLLNEVVVRELDSFRVSNSRLFTATFIWAGMCAQAAVLEDPKYVILLEQVSTLMHYLCDPQNPLPWSEISMAMSCTIWLDLLCDKLGREFWEAACARHAAPLEI